MKKRLVHYALLGVFAVLSFAPVAQAASPLSSVAATCESIKAQTFSCNNKGGNPVASLMLQIIDFLAIGVGIAVVGGIAWGSFLYTTSNGDSGKAQQGISMIVNAVIGLLLFIFTYAIINYLVPGGAL